MMRRIIVRGIGLLLVAKCVYADPLAFSQDSAGRARVQNSPKNDYSQSAKRQASPIQKGSGESRSLQQRGNNSTVLALRRSLLDNYDKMAFPFDEVWGDSAQGTRQGLPVELGLNFHRIYSVDVRSAVADLIVWVRMKWKDPRLAWDPTVYDGNLRFWIGDGNGSGETSEIWTPDLELWNLESSLRDSLVDTFAVASSDGTVFWSRPGHVKAVCRFQGLDDFPFDTLSCTMEIGSWSYSGLYLRPQKFGEGFSIGGSETAGESYAEYSLLSVQCEEFIYPPFPGEQEEDWPVLLYHVNFQRAWEPYARGYLVLQILLNFMAFCCFWIPPHLGERMGLAITSLLAAVASDLVVAANLPTASEVTWFAKFSFTSLLFNALVVFESTVVIHLYFHTEDDVIPEWYKFARRRLRRPCFPEKTTDETPTCPERSSRHISTQSQFMTTKLDADSADSMILEGDEGDSGDEDGSSTSAKDLNVNKTQGRGGDVTDSATSGGGMGRRRAATRPSFATSMTSFRARKGVKAILGRDADDFKNAKEMTNNMKWQKWARRLDSVSRVLFPVAFSIFLAVMFAESKA